MRRYLRTVFLSAIVLGANQSLVTAAPITLDFEQFLDGDTVDNLADPSVTFLNAVVFTDGFSLNAGDFPPKSGANVVIDLTGPLELTFASPISSFSGYFTYTVPLTLQFFDASANTLGTIASSFNDNTGGSGQPPNEFLSASLAGIVRVLITGNAAGASFVLDDLTFDFAPAAPGDPVVPEPGSFLLLSSGAIALIRRRYRSATPRRET